MMWLEDNKLPMRFILHDRDGKLRHAFDQRFKEVHVTPVLSPRLVPEANSFAESWIASLKRECLNHFSCFSRVHLNHIAQTYAKFYNTHRPHQRLGNRTIAEASTGPPVTFVDPTKVSARRVRSQSYLGGLLRHYYRAA